MLHLFVCETLEGRRRLTNTVRMSYFCVIRKGEEEKKKVRVLKNMHTKKMAVRPKKNKAKTSKKKRLLVL